MDRLLIANRGEIARRIAQTCHRLGIATVAVYSDPDADGLFVEEADIAVSLGGRTPAESYLRGDAILAAAKAAGADAIHPGYGFLSENAVFAQAVVDAGLTWIGPSPEAIAAMGSKAEARRRMQTAGVPVLPGSYDVTSSAEVGFPLLVKASAGGGGRGIRLVRAPDELAGAVAAAQSEAGSAFGDGTVFLERYLERARHVEVQILGDQHGKVVALHERDCSVQRRHQKVIEEAPSPAVGPEVRRAMGAAAVAAGEAIGYVGAGTVEFLLVEPEDGGPAEEFFFLEVNTRLQVEHPVTEMVTGLDLVALQIEVAEGGRAVDPPPLRGHAVEARLYAEDAAAGFLPVAGTLTGFGFSEDVRVDAAVRAGDSISTFYDPMLAKVIAHAPTRRQAVARLARALAGADLRGTTTNRDMLVRVLRHPDFVSGAVTTGWLEREEIGQLTEPLLDAQQTERAALAAAIAGALGRHARSPHASLPVGWRNNPSHPQVARYSTPHHAELEVRYRFDRTGRHLCEPVDVVLHRAGPDEVVLVHDGVRRWYRVAEDAVMTAEGQIEIRELSRFAEPSATQAAGSLVSPMPGIVQRVTAIRGDQVHAGDRLLVVEAMKMEQEIVAQTDGRIAEVLVTPGQHVEPGAVLVVIDEAAD